jgi:hypothetical protein
MINKIYEEALVLGMNLYKVEDSKKRNPKLDKRITSNDQK